MLLPFFIYRIVNFIGCIVLALLLIFAKTAVSAFFSSSIDVNNPKLYEYSYGTNKRQPEFGIGIISDSSSDSSSSSFGDFLEKCVYFLLALVIILCGEYYL